MSVFRHTGIFLLSNFLYRLIRQLGITNYSSLSYAVSSFAKGGRLIGMDVRSALAAGRQANYLHPRFVPRDLKIAVGTASIGQDEVYNLLLGLL